MSVDSKKLENFIFQFKQWKKKKKDKYEKKGYLFQNMDNKKNAQFKKKALYHLRDTIVDVTTC